MNFLLKSGDRMFIVGPNGCGKSTLLKILLRRLAPTAGYVREGYNLQIGYYDQENQNLTPENTVFEELHNAYPNLTETEVRNTLALFRFIGDDVFRTVSVLSGGERARLTLAKLMLSKVNLLVLDEPTNHLDIDSREALESALSAFDGTVLAVSHDRYLIDKLATRILSLTPGGTGTLFPVSKPGEGYREYLTDRKSREAQNIPESGKPEEPVSENKAQYLARKEDAARARKEAARRERLKKEAEALEKCEAEKKELEDRYLRLMAEYDNYRRRTQKERENVYPDAVANTLKELLPLLDNLQRALDTPCADENYLTGIKMIQTGFEEYLKKMGVETFGKAGEPFDPNLHNAVMHIEDESLGKNVVAQVFQSGYRRGDRILRHAMVQQAN